MTDDRQGAELGSAADEEEPLAEGTLISHLVELRSRLVKATLAVGIVFLCLAPFSKQIYTLVSEPMQRSLPEGLQMQSIGIAAPFLTPFKTTFFAALFIAMPVVLFQVWQFVAPGLYRKERRFAFPLVLSSIVLFYCGMAFAYFVVFPLVFNFFAAATPEGINQQPDINQYLDFVLTIFLAFGIAFEVPIATFMLVWTRLVSLQSLGKARPYVFLGAFVVGMFLTPPDFISQTLLALPMYLLYESGIVLSRVMLAEQLKEDQAEEEAESEA
jgi:sec-independent protein translocase protein TatC